MTMFTIVYVFSLLKASIKYNIKAFV